MPSTEVRWATPLHDGDGTDQLPVNRKSETPQPLPQTSGEALARKWWLILAAAAAIGLATYVVATLVPASYSSGSTVRVGVLGGGASPQNVSAANDLASQLAQVVGADPVLIPAGGRLGESPSKLRAKVSGGTVADQNIIQIQASGSSPEQAQRRATAVTESFATYVRRLGVAQSNSYNVAARRQLKPLTDQIAQVNRQLSSASKGSARFESLQGTLSTLVSQRSSAVADIAQAAAGGRPAISILAAAGAGAQVQPKPTLYAAVGFLVGLLAVSQLVVFFTPRRRD